MAEIPTTPATSAPDAAVQRYRPSTGGAAGVETAENRGREVGGRKDGSEPTRFGDWEKHGRCIDF